MLCHFGNFKGELEFNILQISIIKSHRSEQALVKLDQSITNICSVQQMLTGRTAVPVLSSCRRGGLQLLQTLLEKFFVLVNEMFLHLRHLSHDLLSSEPSHLCLPLSLCLVFVSHHLHQADLC